MKVSIILPTYNESGNIVELIHEIIPKIPKDWEYEIIVVDDNSPDGTYEKVKDVFMKNEHVVPVLRTKDRSFGRAIRAGIELARGEQLIVMDADFTHDPVEIPKLLQVSKTYDIVSGSRFCSGGSMMDVKHYIASMLYNLFLRLLLRTQIQDNLGGYYTIKKTKIMQLPLDHIYYGYGDCVFRFFYFAKCRKMTIVEIPAIYRRRHAGFSKSNFLKLLFHYTLAAFRLKFDRSAKNAA